MYLYYSWESQPLGTGGALRQALALTHAESLLALNGDSFVACDLPAFQSWHQAHGFAGSLVLAQVEDARASARSAPTTRDSFASFEEKQGRPAPGWINAGVYLLSRWLLELLPEGQPLSLERDAFPAWLPHGLGGYRSSGAFLDIGTPESLSSAEAFLAGVGAVS